MHETMDKAFVTELFNSSNFYCTYCKTGLQYPIKKVLNIGFFCTTCIKKLPHSEFEEIEFESSLTNILIPCKYSYRGCNEKAMFSIMTNHENICLKRDKVCPFYTLGKCSNKDHIQNIIQHFLEYHPFQVRIVDIDKIELSYTIHEELNEFWILMFKTKNFLLNIKRDDKKLVFVMYYIGNIEEVADVTCVIQHYNDDISTQLKSCDIIGEQEFIIPSDKIGLHYDIETLKSYFGNTLTTSVTLKIEGENISNEDIIARLECPICNNFMKNNIMLCSGGHSVCNECQSKLARCAICMLPFNGARNYTLESVSDLLKVTSVETYRCPLQNEMQCPWSGNDHKILEHVKDFHGNDIVFNNSLTTRLLSYTTEFTEVNYLMTLGQVFKITCRKDNFDDVMIVIIELIGHDENAQKYSYNISLNSMYKQNIIWYTKSKVFTRRRIEYHTDYIAIGRIVCNNQFNISYGIHRNAHYQI